MSLEHSDSLIWAQNSPVPRATQSSQLQEGVQKSKQKQLPKPERFLSFSRALQLNLCVLICTWNEFSKFHSSPSHRWLLRM